MIRRAIAILALTAGAASGAAAQTAPVVDAQTGTVTISPQTLEWFRQRLAEEEERLRQLQVTIQQIARGLPRLTEARTFSPHQGPAVPEPSEMPPPIASAPVLEQPLPSMAGTPPVAGSAAGSLTVPGREGRGTPATNGTSRPARIYIPTLDPRNGGLLGDGNGATPPDTSGSPVPVDAIPGGLQEPDIAPPEPRTSSLVPGSERPTVGQPVRTGPVASVTTEPSVVSLAPAPDRSNRRPRMATPALEPVARRVKRAVAGDPAKRGREGRAGKTATSKSRATAVLANREVIGGDWISTTPADPPVVKRKKTLRHPRRYRTSKKWHGKRWTWRHRRSHRVARLYRPRTVDRSRWSAQRRSRDQRAYSSVHGLRSAVRVRRASTSARVHARVAAGHRNCELCRLARAHLRSPHSIIRSRVAGWRTWSIRR